MAQFEEVDLAADVAAVLEMVVHNLRESGSGTLPDSRIGLADHGIIRLNLDDIGRIVVRVLRGEYDLPQVRRSNEHHRARRTTEQEGSPA